jgi:hypothetical protein
VVGCCVSLKWQLSWSAFVGTDIVMLLLCYLVSGAVAMRVWEKWHFLKLVLVCCSFQKYWKVGPTRTSSSDPNLFRSDHHYHHLSCTDQLEPVLFGTIRARKPIGKVSTTFVAGSCTSEFLR